MNNKLLDDDSLMNLAERIGTKLFHLRHERNEKIETVANAINVSHSVVSQVEHGRYASLSLEMVSRFAKYYHVTLDDLLAP